MAGGLDGIVARLEQHKSAIDRALAALRGVEDVDAPSIPMASARKKRGRPRKIA